MCLKMRPSCKIASSNISPVCELDNINCIGSVVEEKGKYNLVKVVILTTLYGGKQIVNGR